MFYFNFFKFKNPRRLTRAGWSRSTRTFPTSRIAICSRGPSSSDLAPLRTRIHRPSLCPLWSWRRPSTSTWTWRSSCSRNKNKLPIESRFVKLSNKVWNLNSRICSRRDLCGRWSVSLQWSMLCGLSIGRGGLLRPKRQKVFIDL